MNNIVKRFEQTGQLPPAHRIEPKYGEAPEMDFFESACIAAEAASALEDNPDLGSEPKEPENGSEDVVDESHNADGTENGEKPLEGSSDEPDPVPES